jgi:holliday junction DNA helicase RuvB
MFYGQEDIKKELEFLIKDVKDSGNNHNILFRAPSGYGKTTASFMLIKSINNGLKDFGYYIPDSDGNITNILDFYRIHFIDEIHCLKHPEILYPLLDSKKYTFILASNESGDLKEPLKNRCIQFIFEPYTEGDMFNIVNDLLIKYKLSKELIMEISLRCKKIPRVAKIICERLDYTFKNYIIPNNLEELNMILQNILHIEKKGLNRQDLIYLDYLQNIESSSLQNIIYGTGIDRETILTEVEPYLLHLGLISITSRGRKINNVKG